MAIVTVPYEGYPAVEVHCDGCDRPIRAAADGVAVYEPAGPGGDVGRVRHAHRAGPCQLMAERAAAGPAGAAVVRPLDFHLAALVLNLGLLPQDLDGALARELLAVGWRPDPPAGSGLSA
jgi:hypothetical protein